jgi:NADH:ubiquinone reductase (H+-translocating)
VVWTAGVKGAPWIAASGLPMARGGRVAVTPELRVASPTSGERSNVYVVGDLALIEGQETLPQVAQVAMQTGTRAAKNIVARVRGESEQPFKYFDYGILAVIGRNAAVADMGPLHFKGFGAWLLWIAIHIAKLIGFRNRALVLVNWAWNYLRFRRAVRLILPAEGRSAPR